METSLFYFTMMDIIPTKNRITDSVFKVEFDRDDAKTYVSRLLCFTAE